MALANNPTGAALGGPTTVTAVAQGKKHKSNPVALAQASYDPSTLTVTLTTRKRLVLRPPLQLRIIADVLTDA